MREGAAIRHVLLVDDNDDLRQTTRELLVALGYEVTSAASAEEAEAAYDQAPDAIDALISDVDMPGATGVDLADRLQATNPALPVLLISSRLQNPAVDRRVQAERLSFLPKPFSSDQLATAAAHLAPPTSDSGRGGEARRGAGSRHLLVVAALATVLLGGLWVTLRPGPPALPRPAETGVQRGSTIEVALQEVLTETPATLRFSEVSGAERYRLTLRKVDETLLWQDQAPGSPAPLPDSVVQQLLPHVSYCWQVEALDRLEARLAWSPQTCFRLAVSAPDHLDLPTTQSDEDGPS